MYGLMLVHVCSHHQHASIVYVWIKVRKVLLGILVLVPEFLSKMKKEDLVFFKVTVMYDIYSCIIMNL